MKNCIFLILLFPLLINAQKYLYHEERFPAKPTNYITDEANVLTKDEEDQLNTKLKNFEDNTSNQLFVYITRSLKNKNLEDYSKEIFNTWGIGQKDKNNGILIAIFIEDRKYRIQIGYGLEAVLPSTLTKEIQDDEMKPHFKEADYYSGIDVGVDKLMYYSKHEFKLKDPNEKLYIVIGISYLISVIFYSINLSSIKKWKNQPKRRKKNVLACTIFLILPLLNTVVFKTFNLSNIYLLFIPPILCTLALIGLCTVINDKKESIYDNETDNDYERRMQRERLSSSSDSSDSDSFSGGGGGSSDTGGSSSDW